MGGVYVCHVLYCTLLQYYLVLNHKSTIIGLKQCQSWFQCCLLGQSISFIEFGGETAHLNDSMIQFVWDPGSVETLYVGPILIIKLLVAITYYIASKIIVWRIYVCLFVRVWWSWNNIFILTPLVSRSTTLGRCGGPSHKTTKDCWNTFLPPPGHFCDMPFLPLLLRSHA